MLNLCSDFVFVFSGLVLTLQITVGAICIAIFLGTMLAFLRFKLIGHRIINLFISIIRGTPLILQLSLVYFAFPQIFGTTFSVLVASIFAFGLNSSAYTAEILRGGIENIPKGQFEAAKSLHIPDFFVWKDIICPQLLKNVTPTLIHEFISLIKETAIVSTIGGLDVMRKAQMLSAEHFVYFKPLMMAGVSYYCIILFIEYLGRKLENKLKYAKNK